jgi:hypothetical protein
MDTASAKWSVLSLVKGEYLQSCNHSSDLQFCKVTGKIWTTVMFVSTVSSKCQKCGRAKKNVPQGSCWALSIKLKHPKIANNFVTDPKMISLIL